MQTLFLSIGHILDDHLHQHFLWPSSFHDAKYLCSFDLIALVNVSPQKFPSFPLLLAAFKTGLQKLTISSATQFVTFESESMKSLLNVKELGLNALRSTSVLTSPTNVFLQFIQLIVFRGFAGAGGGGIVSMMQIVVSDIVTLRERGKYQGIIQGVIVIGYTVGPLIGGDLSQSVMVLLDYHSGFLRCYRDCSLHPSSEASSKRSLKETLVY
ncbi:uncharacterized protein ARMOST_22567 [Armillaria ostoyae]|uniref:Major facilitator superfamily (MFS) profile domain-containing protein n=1 Tax=Armillaria ostoyae TaxID=47428 RepID=A0A284SD67_ARMOS|nr:uncharacterized protein ARMOST_22567 [Armillaria ostoyae]